MRQCFHLPWRCNLCLELGPQFWRAHKDHKTERKHHYSLVKEGVNIIAKYFFFGEISSVGTLLTCNGFLGNLIFKDFILMLHCVGLFIHYSVSLTAILGQFVLPCFNIDYLACPICMLIDTEPPWNTDTNKRMYSQHIMQIHRALCLRKQFGEFNQSHSCQKVVIAIGKGQSIIITFIHHTLSGINKAVTPTWPWISPQTVTGVETGWTFDSSRSKSQT